MDVLDLKAKLSLDTTEYESSLSQAGSGATTFGDVLKANLTGGLIEKGVSKLTRGISDFAKASIEAGMDFDSAMAQVAATMGTTVDDIQDLRGFAQEMGSTTAFSATQAAEALNYMALAGYDAETSMAMLPNVLNLAAAGNIDLAYASDMVTDAQSALGLSLEETTDMVDQMAAASSRSNTSVSQLGEAILTIGATARSVRGGTTRLTTILGALADNGIKGAEGGTHLRNIILSLQNPTSDAAAIMEDLNVQIYDADGNMNDLVEIIADLQEGLGEMDDASRDAAISGIFNKADLASVNALLNTTQERFDELTDAIDDAHGAAERMADTQLDNLAGSITLYQSALEGLRIQISDAVTPALQTMVGWATDGLTWLTNIMTPATATEQAVARIQDAQDRLASSEEILDLAQQYRELRVKVQDASLSEEEAAETAETLEDVRNRLAIATGNAKIAEGEYNDELDTTVELEAQAAEVERLQAQIEMWRNLRNGAATYQSQLQQLSSAEAELADAEERRSSALEQQYAGNRDILASVGDKIDEVKSKLEGMDEGAEKADYLATSLGELEDAFHMLGVEADLTGIAQAEEIFDELADSGYETVDALESAQVDVEGLTATIDRLSSETDDFRNNVLSLVEDGFITSAEAADLLGVTVAEIPSMLDEYAEAQEDATEAAEDFADATEDVTESVDASAAMLEEITSSYPRYAEAVGKAGVSLEELSDTLVNNGISAAEWAAAVDSATADVINDFAKADTDLGMSLDEMAANLQANIQAQAEWNTNIATLMAAAEASGDASKIAFVQHMQEMGVGAADQVAAMVQDVDGTLDTFGPLFEDAAAQGITSVMSALDDGAGDVASTSEEVMQSGADAASSVAESEGPGIGLQLDSGIALGLVQGQAGVIAAGVQVMDAAIGAMKARAEIQSPSHVMRDEVGVMLTRGVAVGMTDSAALSEVDRSAGDIMDRVSDAFGSVGYAGSYQYSAATATVNGAVDNAEIVSLLQLYLPMLAQRPIAIDGDTLVGATVARMDQQLGTRSVYAGRGLAG